MPPDPAPEFDAVAILEVLSRHRLQFVVIGGYAAQLSGALVDTEDVDITPATSPENLDRLAAALAAGRRRRRRHRLLAVARETNAQARQPRWWGLRDRQRRRHSLPSPRFPVPQQIRRAS